MNNPASKAPALPSNLSISQLLMIALGLVSLMLPLLGWLSFSRSPAEVDSPVAQRQLISSRISALGRIEPVGSVVTVGAPINEIVAKLAVQEGDWLKEGDVVAYLRSAAERMAEFDRAEQALAVAKLNLQTETQYAEAQVAAASTDYANLPAVQTEGLAAQAAVVSRLRRDLAFEQQELSRYEVLYRQGALARNDIEQRRSAVAQTEAQLQQELATLQQKQATGERDIANARANLTTTQANANRAISQRQVAIAQRELVLAEVRVENSLVRAPISGQVLRVITRTGETVSDNGRGKGAVVDMANTDQMNVIAEVFEANIQQVQLGQPALITSRNGAFEGELTGTVSVIGNQIFKKDVLNDDPTARVDARVVEVKILLDNPSLVAGLTNLQVDVEINTTDNETLPLSLERSVSGSDS